MEAGVAVGAGVASTWGSRNNMPGYDKFRTGLSYRDVWEMMRDDSPDTKHWRYKRRGTVLGAWHELKLQLYHQAMSLNGCSDSPSGFEKSE
jgi:hypothetical protein